MNWHSLLKSGIYPILIMLACLAGISLALPRQESVMDLCNKDNCPQSLQPKSLQPQSSNQLTIPQIKQIADSITVKISSKKFLGSGTLLKRENNIYTAITNAHVIGAAKPPYQIQTPDGFIYQATVTETVKLNGNDLGLLQFRSNDAVYEVANLGDYSTLGIKDRVFVSGFTPKANIKLQGKGKQNTNNVSLIGLSKSPLFTQPEVLVFTTGTVSLLLEKALKGGYQIGYTNDIRKGMSGAPLLNIRGEVVGINGLHKEPLWDAADLYEDGTEPSKSLQDKITRSSFAIPVNTVLKQFSTLNISKDFDSKSLSKNTANEEKELNDVVTVNFQEKEGK